MTRNFDDDLAYSNSPEVEAFWDRVYRKSFPTMVWHTPNMNNNTAQRLGVDRQIYLGCNKFLTIDEKIDSHPAVNFFLEFVSVDGSQAPGWIEKDLAVDFVAYGFIKSGEYFLLPWPALQQAWRANAAEWRKTYKTHQIANRSYKTIGIAVPIKVVLQAVNLALRGRIDPEAD